jgi:hypothetical protein
VVVTREILGSLHHHDVERLLGAVVLSDERLHRPDDRRVLEDGMLDIEDRGVASRRPLRPRADTPNPILRPHQRVVQPHDLGIDLLVGNDAVPDIGDLPDEEVHRSDDDPRRRRDPDDAAVH